uniref:Uncharacterized protein n=1 Tax=Caloglossa beccarii TaxID=131038 RepID=A0A1Z1M8E9_9FLOR|nr:hypothetical protein [Caloglossa beccarii]ARW62256.1 hypothetical protein [Caloglossa beccarii]
MTNFIYINLSLYTHHLILVLFILVIILFNQKIIIIINLFIKIASLLFL